MDDQSKGPGPFAKGSVGRFLLGISIGTIVLCVAACGFLGAATMLASGGFVASHWDEFEEAGDDGATFAAVGHTIGECVDEARARGASDCALLLPICGKMGIFVRRCVATAEDDFYCATVPSSDDPVATSAWTRASCAGTTALWCESLMGDVLSACERRMERREERPRGVR